MYEVSLYHIDRFFLSIIIVGIINTLCSGVVINCSLKFIIILCLANISQNSRATDGTTLIYADIGPNAVNRVQMVVVPDHSNYKVQYAAINYNAKFQNLCVPIASMTKVVEDELKSGIYSHT